VRIALVGPTHPYKGGIAQHTTRLAHALADAGDDVELVSWSAQYPDRLYPGVQRLPWDRPEVPPFPATRYPLSWARPDSWWVAGRSLRAFDAALLVLATPLQVPPYRTMLAARGVQGGRVATVAHNVLPHELRPGDRALVRGLLRRSELVVTHTEALRAQAAALGAQEAAALPLPPLLADTEAPRTPGCRRTLLFFGLIRPYKGLDVLLEALARAPDVRLVVAGEVWGDPEVWRDQVASLGLERRVDLRLGYVEADRLPGLFAEADALVLPYRSGTATANVDLARQHGVPVLCSGIPALTSVVRPDVDALVVEPGDVGGLAAAIRRLYQPGELARLTAGVRPPDLQAAWAGYAREIQSRLRGR
jgi:glycosyltransferase involved in cell wall biosynthesis